MRVAIFTETYFPFISGVVTHIKTLKDELEAKGHQVLIVTTDPNARFHYLKNDVLYCPAKSVKKIYGYGVTTPISLRRLEYIKDFNPDIIHIHTEFSMGIFGMWVAKMLKKPIVYTLHTMYEDYTFYVIPKNLDKFARPALHMYFKNVAKKATEIIGPSLKVVEFLKRCGVTRHINIIPNITDLTLFLKENIDSKKVNDLKIKYNIKENDTTICFVGRLGKEKSVNELLQFFAYGFAGKKEYKMFIIGDGPEASSLKELAKKLDIQNQIIFTGKVDHNDIACYYYASDIYATASLTEINSISMLEAMASGLMVLQRFDLFNKDQIVKGENGYLYHDGGEFVQLVQQFHGMTIPERLASRETVYNFSRRYGPNEFIDKVLNVYEIAIHKYKSKNN
ncbi:MAG: glycosyltransferase [Oscillospiraceae bacterium]